MFKDLTKSWESGFTLITMLIIMPFLLLISAIFLNLSVNGYRISLKDQYRTHAQFAADAGADVSVQELNENPGWAGTAGQIELHNDGQIKTTYEVTVADNGADNKTVTAIGRTFRPVGSAAPKSTVRISVNLRAVRTGDYSVVSGVGGMIMRNSAKVVNGSVYINGTLAMSNSAQIGLAILPVPVKVAHQTCPTGSSPGPTYPRVCNSGENGQPISISNTSHIYGEVRATNQTSGAGMSNTGLVAGSSEPPVPLPAYDRNAQKAAVASTITGTSAGCAAGTKTWPANLKITGNVTISLGCVVTVEGNVWITGNLDTKNLAQMVVKSGLTTPPVIMIDGSTGLNMRNSSAMLPNVGLVGFRVITYYSTASCSPDCADVTGNDLYNSKSVTTIRMQESASGAQTEFYAHWTKVDAGNSGSVGALAGQTIDLSNSIAVTFGTSITGFGDTIWVIDDYKRIF